MQTIFRTEDGQEFNDAVLAQRHETELTQTKTRHAFAGVLFDMISLRPGEGDRNDAAFSLVDATRLITRAIFENPATFAQLALTVLPLAPAAAPKTRKPRTPKADAAPAEDPAQQQLPGTEPAPEVVVPAPHVAGSTAAPFAGAPAGTTPAASATFAAPAPPA